MIEVFESNEFSTAALDREIIARIGPSGVEWRAGRLTGDIPENDHITAADSLEEARRVCALAAIRQQQQQWRHLQEEREILAEIARKRGPGSLHDDLTL